MLSSSFLAFVIAAAIIPILLILSLVCLVRWIVKEEEKKLLTKRAIIAIATPTALSILFCFLPLTNRWASSLYRSYPIQATVVQDFSASIIDNSWWHRHYGESYQIGKDRYNDAFCVPNEQFALATVQWICPFHDCESTLLAWSCGHRSICRDDCTLQVDDQYQQHDYDCVIDNDDDDNINNDDDTITTKNDLLECVEAIYPVDSVINVITNCHQCTALTHEDYRWTSGTKKLNRLNFSLAMAGIFLSLISVVLYWQRKRIFAIPKDDEKQDPLVVQGDSAPSIYVSQ
mmetsp:Transcript_19463/g.29265  ORF Transcript_19463/g.29265 Transcript_19463/m.29265 type:complete len:288 (+) Transcript_19463:101-964(+)|eukprot:CAMPEP_0178928838 /NCGR_PEP_ID=MMETSP0786-20121207/20173_1 /TAXON_ID=186022 /ORGANISM="Thalassionema frauenfeldii, Strain CCMP 1798" /LENGTH=287 /DNA_ID=CAMNT_0020604841 /DNA_START=14 /DNA_END=877 /DNA_ORIENTATION=-